MKKTKLSLLILLAILLTSCKTMPPLQDIIEPFGVIGNEADAYVYIPIKGNIDIIQKAIPFASGKDIKIALARTEEIFSGIFFDGISSEVRICAKGKYPYQIAGSFFKKKNGWHSKKTKSGYRYYESDFVDVSIPSPAIACIGLGSKKRQKMDVILDKLKAPATPEFSPKFNSLLNSGTGDIGIFVKNSDFFLSQILGVHLGLPLSNIEMYLQKGSSLTNAKMYKYDLSIQVENPRTAMVLKLFLKKTLQAEVEIDKQFVLIKNRVVTEEKIISIIKSIYPY